MNMLHNIDKFLTEYAAILIIAAYFGWFVFKNLKNIIAEARQNAAEYDAKYGSLEGLSDIYKRRLAGEREPNFLDHLKIALLKYADAFRETTGKYGVLTMRLIATGAGVALLLYVVDTFFRAGV